MNASPRPFLRIPPFPGHRAPALAVPRRRPAAAVGDPAPIVRALAGARVGGDFWAARPPLSDGHDLVLAPKSQPQADAMLRAAEDAGLADRLLMLGRWAAPGAMTIALPADPWHIVAHAAVIWADAGDELALVGAIAGKPLRLWGEGRFSALSDAGRESLNVCVVRELVHGFALHDPFSGSALAPEAAIALLAEWRSLIDANREIVATFGIALWKRETLDVLLWGGEDRPCFPAEQSRVRDSLVAGDRVLAWKAKVAPDFLVTLAACGVHVGEIEDGMVRSSGLGANCVPPLSVIVDFDGAHFDPAQPSRLERLLESATIDAVELTRAAALRAQLIAEGISKYGRDTSALRRPTGSRRRVLVAAQVEDDRSVQLGGAGCTNRDLVRRARELEPDAYLVYKPHPDVEAGHRKGHVPDAEILAYADEVDRQSSIQALLDSVSGVHVMTSLAGFEALMRGREVTTHGVPFYAGWGLTRDLGPVPRRRTRRRSLDELVAVALILYPRYVDPVTLLPCPVEVVVRRLAADQARSRSPLVALRRAQGQLKLVLARFRGELE